MSIWLITNLTEERRSDMEIANSTFTKVYEVLPEVKLLFHSSQTFDLPSYSLRRNWLSKATEGGS